MKTGAARVSSAVPPLAMSRAAKAMTRAALKAAGAAEKATVPVAAAATSRATSGEQPAGRRDVASQSPGGGGGDKGDGHFCQKIQQKGFPRAVATIREALDRWVHYHKKEQASRKPGKLPTSMANVLLIFLSFPTLKSVDLTDQRLILRVLTDPAQAPGVGCRPQQTLTA